MANHPCECCGHRTLDEKTGGTYQICPVCFWEDAPFSYENWSIKSSNGVSLREAQNNYANFGASDKSFLEASRPPTADETKPEKWLTIDQQAQESRSRLIAQIEKAFSSVTREGGVSLHETEGIDQYYVGDGLIPFREKDTDRRWQDVKHEDLAEVCGIGGISFFDPIGWRYHLPAYMTWWLHDGEQSDSVAAEYLLYSLELEAPKRGGLRQHSLERYKSLNTQQAIAVTQFLNHVLHYAEEPLTREDAKKAPKAYWHQFED